MNVYLNDGHILQVHCPQVNDNWAQNTKRICSNTLGAEGQQFQMKSLLLQSAGNNGYIMLQGEMYSPLLNSNVIFDIPASEIKHMLSRAQTHQIVGSELVMMAFTIVACLFGCKWVLEKYLLPKFS